jgi:hypothetical protein
MALKTKIETGSTISGNGPKAVKFKVLKAEKKLKLKRNLL